MPLVPTFLFRDGRLGARAVVRPPIRSGRGGSGDLSAEAAEIVSHLEWAIAHRPHQWYCFRDLWPENGASRRDPPAPLD